MPLDAAGAFAASFAVPESASAGPYSVLAQAGGGVGGATVDVDANAAGLSLQVTATCGRFCDPRRDVPLLVHSSRGSVTVRVAVVRSPHVYFGDTPASTPWATAPWLDATVRTGDDGNATVDLPHPDDELASTYGVHVEAGGATADTRVTVPTAEAAMRLAVDRSEQSIGAPLGFDVYAESLDGKPLADAVVTVDMTHGASVARQQLMLDGDGHARGSFNAPDLGTNFLFATVDHGGSAMDAAQVRVDPQAAGMSTDGESPNVHVRLDRTSYRAGEDVAVDAQGDGSHGQALVTFESALGIEARVVRVNNGSVVARLRAANAAGELRVGAAFVRDGSIEWTTIPLALAAPGRPLFAALALGSVDFAPGAPAQVRLDGSARLRDVRRAHQPRRAVGKRAVRIRAGAARRRRNGDAKQRAGSDHVASVGELDRRSRAGAWVRAPHGAAAGTFARAGRDASRSRGASGARMTEVSRSRCPIAAAGTIFRCSRSPTTAASAPAPRSYVR